MNSCRVRKIVVATKLIFKAVMHYAWVLLVPKDFVLRSFVIVCGVFVTVLQPQWRFWYCCLPFESLPDFPITFPPFQLLSQFEKGLWGVCVCVCGEAKHLPGSTLSINDLESSQKGKERDLQEQVNQHNLEHAGKGR